MKKKGTSQNDYNRMSYFSFGNHSDIVGMKVSDLFGSLDDTVEFVENKLIENSDSEFEVIYEIKPVMIVKRIIAVGREPFNEQKARS